MKESIFQQFAEFIGHKVKAQKLSDAELMAEARHKAQMYFSGAASGTVEDLTDDDDEDNEDKIEEPKAEEPAEEPKTEDPKAEEPAEEPKTEDPKTEDPKTEEPKAEDPKTEEPKAEEPAEDSKTEDPKTEEPVEEPETEEPEKDDTDEKRLSALEKQVRVMANAINAPKTINKPKTISMKKSYFGVTDTAVLKGAQLQDAFGKHIDGLQKRFASLNTNNLLSAMNYKSMIKGEGASIEFDMPESVADQYLVRRQDLLIAYLRELPTVTNIFPVHSGVQDKEAAPELYVGGLSQAWTGKNPTAKGNFLLSATIYEVKDVFAYIDLYNMKDIEKQYVGYLNTEGATAVKWSFVEWLTVYIAKQLISEQNYRRVSGTYVEGADNYLNAADGVIAAIRKAVDDNRVLPFEIGGYTQATILDVFEAMWAQANLYLQNIDGYKLYANARHKQWYIAAYHAKYGQTSAEFSQNSMYNTLAPENIIWVPNMPINSTLIFITEEGNNELLEDKAGEMLAFRFVEKAFGVEITSQWREGVFIKKTGKKFDTAEELVANNYENQFLFVNSPEQAFTTGSYLAQALDWTVSADVDITNSKVIPGQVYSIANAGNDTVTITGIGEDGEELASGEKIYVYPKIVDGVATGKFVVLA